MTTEVRRKSILKMCPSNAADPACESCTTCVEGDHGDGDAAEKSVTIVDIRQVPPENANKWLDDAEYVWEYFKVDLYDVFELDHMPILTALGCDKSGFAKSKPEIELLKTIDNALKPIDRSEAAKGLTEDQFLDAADHIKSKVKSKDGLQCSFNSVLMRLGSLLAQLGHEIQKGSNVSTALCQECFSKIVQLTGFMSEATSPDGCGKVSLEVKDNTHFAHPNLYINLPMPVSAVDELPAKLLATVHVWGEEVPEEKTEEAETQNNNEEDEDDDDVPSMPIRPPTPPRRSSVAVAEPPTTYVVPAPSDDDSDYTDTLDKDSDLAKISRSKFANLRLDESLKSVSDTWTCPPNCNLIIDGDLIAKKSHLAVVFGDMLCTYKQCNVFEWSAKGCEANYRLGFSVQGSKVQVVAMELLSDVALQLSSHQMVRHHHIPLYISPEIDLLRRNDRNAILRFLLQLKYTASGLNPW